MPNINQQLRLKYNPANIGKLVRYYREYYNYKSAYVAKKLRVTQGNYSKMENGRIELGTTRIGLICKLYQVSPMEFFTHFDFNKY